MSDALTIRDLLAVQATEADIENHRAYTIHPVSGRPIYTMSIERAKYVYADAMLIARGETDA